MQKHQDALLMRGTPKERVAVAGRAIVHVTTVKVTVSNAKVAISLVQGIMAPTKPPRVEATGLITPLREKQRVAIVPDTIAREATSNVKEVISLVPDIIVKVAISSTKEATSSVKVAIVPVLTIIERKVASSLVKVAISPVPTTTKKAATSLARVAISQKRAASIVVPAQPAIILMPSTA